MCPSDRPFFYRALPGQSELKFSRAKSQKVEYLDLDFEIKPGMEWNNCRKFFIGSEMQQISQKSDFLRLFTAFGRKNQGM